MFALINGRPEFYVGKINDIGYTSEEEKEQIITRLKKEDPNVEIVEEKVEVEDELRDKAEKLAKLDLTHSKSEFMRYLTGEKAHPTLETRKLKEENEKLKLALSTTTMEVLNTINSMEQSASIQQAQLLMEITKMIEAMGGEK